MSPSMCRYMTRLLDAITLSRFPRSSVLTPSFAACLAICSTAPPSCLDATDSNAATKCACEDKAYVANSTACLEVTCTSAEQFDAAQKMAIFVCAQQGVSLKASGTWKGPDATQTSTDSASPAS